MKTDKLLADGVLLHPGKLRVRSIDASQILWVQGPLRVSNLTAEGKRILYGQFVYKTNARKVYNWAKAFDVDEVELVFSVLNSLAKHPKWDDTFKTTL